jgi:hypothetical protein
MSDRQKFTENFDTLVALITNLPLDSNHDSRTAPQVAKVLHLDPAEVAAVFDAFPCFFRRSIKTEPGSGEYYFSIHARYARRLPKSPDGHRPPTPTLEHDELSSIFELVIDMVKNESQRADLHQKTQTLYVTTVVTMIAAAIAVWRR